MEKALATFHNGRVEFDRPVTWPDGTRLEVMPSAARLGLVDDDRPETQEEIDDWLEWFKTVEPYDMTPDELDALDAELKANKEIQKQLLRESWQKEDRG
jgi:hypothetical protein